MSLTTLSDLINPQVMADMIAGGVREAIVVTPFARIDTTLRGVPGKTITVPRYAYIGDAVDVDEAEDCPAVALTATTTQATVKKAMRAVTLTDEAVMSGYGNPVGEANSQLAKSIASKIDVDCMNELMAAELTYNASSRALSYDGIVDAIDLFREEKNGPKVMFIHPAQVAALRKDELFLSADRYIAGGVVMTGEIGLIAGCRVVPSRRVPIVDAAYCCPIVRLEESDREDSAPALTIYLKGDVNLETERHSLNRTTTISVDQHYAAALSNSEKVVIAKFSAAPLSMLTVTRVAGTNPGTVKLTVSPAKTAGNKYLVRVGDPLVPAYHDRLSNGVNGWMNWNGTADIAATMSLGVTVAEVDSAGLVKKSGCVR